MLFALSVAAQDDVLLPTTTPREALQFAAALRLPTPHYTKQQQAVAVDRLIDGMKLEHCADTLVSSHMWSANPACIDVINLSST